ncbi:MAG: helix-turn-helix transcriptional regulator [Oscillospiraceae bacterium]|nr:helix-turn-helix transcriptional regulator [Oscillospiraceae bacterium]
MNQQKTGEFLKNLRREKGLTQEQLAEHFYVSSRTVSRWETGSNMPDVYMLIDLADFYDVDIREIIDGERKSANMDSEMKDTLKKVAEYAAEESRRRKERLRMILVDSMVCVILFYILFGNGYKGYLYGTIDPVTCNNIMQLAVGVFIALLGVYALNGLGAFDRIGKIKQNIRNNKS